MRLLTRLSAAVFALLCFFSSLPAQAAAARLTSQRGSSVFTSPEFGFSIKYPKDWDTLENPTDVLLLLQSSDENAAIAVGASNAVEDVHASDLTPKTVEALLGNQIRILKKVRLKFPNTAFTGKAFLGTQALDDGSMLRTKYVFMIRGKTVIIFSLAASSPTVFAKSVRAFDKLVASISAR